MTLAQGQVLSKILVRPWSNSKEIENSLASLALRGLARKLRNKISEQLQEGSISQDTFYLNVETQTIQQKIKSLKKLNDEIIELNGKL